MRYIIQILDGTDDEASDEGNTLVLQCHVTIPWRFDDNLLDDDNTWGAFNGGCLKYYRGNIRRDIDSTEGYNLRIGVWSRPRNRQPVYYFGLSLYGFWDSNALSNDGGYGILEKWFAGPNMQPGYKRWKLVDSSIFG